LPPNVRHLLLGLHIRSVYSNGKINHTGC